MRGSNPRRQPPESPQHESRQLAKSAGDYSHPATRHIFEMARELKALIVPLQAEENRRATRTRHLEEIMAQWNECAECSEWEMWSIGAERTSEAE